LWYESTGKINLRLNLSEEEFKMTRIAFAGTDGRTLMCSWVVSTAVSDTCSNDYQGVVVRGTPAMSPFCEIMSWPVDFIPTASNQIEDYVDTIVLALNENRIDFVVPMPEALLFEGIVDRVAAAGFEDRIMGLTKEAAFIEGDKIRCKQLCQEAGIPVAPAWTQVDAKDYQSVLKIALCFLSDFGGAVLKFPYSAGGKGARIVLNSWEVRQVYDQLINDYKDSYRQQFGKKNPWPLLVEARMSGMEISFTILVDCKGNFQILPTAMDYPERFEGPASMENPITGGTGALSPHPMETPLLLEMAGDIIARPLVQALRQRGYLRPCILYPGCFISLNAQMQPTQIRVCEINIRPGEPEAQPVARRLRNLGALLTAAMQGTLDRVQPEVREDQLSACIALMTGPGGPDGQKGYPWSCTKGEPIEIDTKYLKRKGIQVIPSAMSYSSEEGRFKSDGTRVAFLNANATIKPGENRGVIANRLRNKLLAAFDNGKIRVIPREDPKGNRLDIRRDIGTHYQIGEQLFKKN
jgi:phosphoribosylamine---glycine ligase